MCGSDLLKEIRNVVEKVHFQQNPIRKFSCLLIPCSCKQLWLGTAKQRNSWQKKFVVRLVMLGCKHRRWCHMSVSVKAPVCPTTLQISCEMARVANMKGMIVFCIMDAGTCLHSTKKFYLVCIPTGVRVPGHQKEHQRFSLIFFYWSKVFDSVSDSGTSL